MYFLLFYQLECVYFNASPNKLYDYYTISLEIVGIFRDFSETIMGSMAFNYFLDGL